MYAKMATKRKKVVVTKEENLQVAVDYGVVGRVTVGDCKKMRVEI